MQGDPISAGAGVERSIATGSELDVLRLVACGAADAGKSTLIGRLLYEAGQLPDDQPAALQDKSGKSGGTGGELDFPLLVDGLRAAYARGDKVDAASRNFATVRREFVVADTPGHEQYTRSLASGARTAQLAVMLIDARKGVSAQTRRHSYIVSLLGIRHVVLAVNKMDLVDYSRDAYDAIVTEYRGFAGQLDFAEIQPIPVSALKGDNISAPGSMMPWYRGPTLIEHLERVDIGSRQTGPVATEPEASDQFRVHILWMTKEPMLPGRSYALNIGAQTAQATVSDLRYVINVNTHEHTAAKFLALNEIGVCNISLDRAVAYHSYAENRETGSFVLIDRPGGNTVAAGIIDFGLRRADNLAWQALQIDKSAHSRMKNQKPCVLWFTGLSGSGKSTIADLVEKRLYLLGKHTLILDGDNVRHGLNRDLGFTEADRVENIRRIGEVSKLFVDAGLIVLVSFISPFESERQMARKLMAPDEFLEIFVDTPLEICEQRDPKGLYRKARAGQIANFTGIDSPYEIPTHSEISVATANASADDLAEQIIQALNDRGII